MVKIRRIQKYNLGTVFHYEVIINENELDKRFHHSLLHHSNLISK